MYDLDKNGNAKEKENRKSKNTRLSTSADKYPLGDKLDKMLKAKLDLESEIERIKLAAYDNEVALVEEVLKNYPDYVTINWRKLKKDFIFPEEEGN